jgi:hypothetical protein
LRQANRADKGQTMTPLERLEAIEKALRIALDEIGRLRVALGGTSKRAEAALADELRQMVAPTEARN